MSVTLTQLRALVAVCRHGSVQSAAEHLVVTQPSVSAAVAALSRELGTPLLQRRGRGCEPTPAGIAFLPYAEQTLGLLDQGRQAARAAAEPGTGRVRVIAVNTAGEYVMPSLIRAFRRASPGIEVLLEIGNRRDVIDRLRARRADLGVGGRPMRADLAGRPLLDHQLVVVAADPAADPVTATWLMREEGSGTRATLEAYLAEQGIEPAEQLTLGSNGAVKQALAIGLGVTLISRLAVSSELAGGRLHEIAAPGTPIPRTFHLITSHLPPPAPPVRRLIDFLVSPAARAALS
jgi:DNA-binding transcriptional LysR family regulator